MGLRKTLWISSLASIVFCASAGADDALDDQTLARRVDGVLVAMRSRTGRGDAVAALRDLGPRAVPRLLHHLRTGRRDDRLLALSCLQYCWEDTAREPVVDALIGDDAMARDLARSVLARHLSPAQLTEAMAPLIDDPDPDVAGPALRAVQRAEPDANALADALLKPAMWRHLHDLLPRHRSALLGPATRRIARNSRGEMLRSAWLALTMQLDDSPEARARALAVARSRPPADREIAALYLAMLAQPPIEPLSRLAGRQRDPYAQAALAWAARAVALRERRFARDGGATEPPSDQARLGAWIDALAERPSAELRRGALRALRREGGVEPVHRYGGRGSDTTPADDRRRAERRTELLLLLCGQTLEGVDSIGERSLPRRVDPCSPAPAGRFMAPVRDYFDPRRRSFAAHVGTDRGGPFAGSVHVGDDVAWHEPGRAVVSIADGIVRSVRIDAPSWGGLVIVEHADEDGALCSLYAHLGSIIPVRAGDRVKAGDLIGTVGRGLTRANGGYHAHLHFGIHRGPYRTAWREGDEAELFVNGAVQRAEVVSVGPEYATFSLAGASKRARLSRRAWIGGYLDPREFRADKHGWVDPQAFLHQRRHASGPSTAPPGEVGRRRRGRP